MTFDASAPALPDSGIYGLTCGEDEARVHLLPVPFDATTSYRSGTANGPRAIFEASKQVDLYDRQTGRPYEAGIYMPQAPARLAELNAEARAAAEKVIAAGGVREGRPELAAAAATVNRLSHEMNDWVYEEVRSRLRRGKFVGVVGGDHSVPFGAIKACAERYPGLGVLHLDAHADLRHAYEGFVWSHASIMFNVVTQLSGVERLVQVGVRDFSETELELIERSGGRVTTHFDADLAASAFEGIPWRAQVDRIVSALPADVYLSFDIDGLEPAFCPHTGTPVPGGLSFNQAIALVEAVRRAQKRIVGFDLNEVAPGPEGDEWDANVAARLLYKMIGFAL